MTEDTRIAVVLTEDGTSHMQLLQIELNGGAFCLVQYAFEYVATAVPQGKPFATHEVLRSATLAEVRETFVKQAKLLNELGYSLINLGDLRPLSLDVPRNYWPELDDRGEPEGHSARGALQGSCSREPRWSW